MREHQRRIEPIGDGQLVVHEAAIVGSAPGLHPRANQVERSGQRR